MKFNYKSYENLIRLLKSNGYCISDYVSWESANSEKIAILRHDIDYSIEKSVILSDVEKELGITSTYFVLLSSNFYNIFSKKSQDGLRKILENGCKIGLHFDETQYYPKACGNAEEMVKDILREKELLSNILGFNVDCVSMHRASSFVLDNDLKVPGMINSYSGIFFKEFKYVSDSRMHWKEPVEDIITTGEENRLHILTHAFWYGVEEDTIENVVAGFVNRGSYDRYLNLKENIRDIEAIMKFDADNL